ncbi:MAG: hypothetical protein AB8B81_15030 [Halioglobus sp.]
MKKLLLLAASSLLLTACSADLPTITGCEAVGDIRPVCGMQTPEDIAALDDGKHLLLSHFAGMEHGSGSVSVFNIETQTRVQQFPPLSGVTNTRNAQWGDAGCAPPDPKQFRPHGTHLRQLHDGRWRYLVVNHGGRESIEMFELMREADEYSLDWRGCVLAAEDTFMNDVVGLANGDLLFTRMFHRTGDLEMLKSVLGITTGDLWRWNKETGLRILPGTDAAQPNGLEVSADEKFVYANMYMEKQVWKVDAETGETVATASLTHGADNSAWGTDGRLWAVIHTDGIAEMLSCFETQQEPCAASFEVVAIDPETMETEVVFAHAGAPMGAATVAVPQRGRVYLGSFVGDRMISVANFSPAAQ